ncbi:MAG: hypothetical protein ACRD8Z_23100, partial [Nitrososphaeraceae archaeon]
MSGSNIDSGDNHNDPAGHAGTQNSGTNGGDEHSSFNHQSTPERWILVLAITILAFGVILLTLRSVIFSLILITIGISLFAYWSYLGVRSKEQNQSLPEIKPGAKQTEYVCTCSICKHTESGSCMDRRCPCCILTRNKQIIGH